jgi:hypothetical protein
MQPITILALLAGSALAAAPGSVCKTNVECNANCIDSKWTIAAQTDGSYKLVCDPTISDGTQHYSSTCNKFNGFGAEYDKAATASACTKVGGLSCANGCVSSGKKSGEIAFRASWSIACGVTELVTAPVVVRSSEKETKDSANCG